MPTTDIKNPPEICAHSTEFEVVLQSAKQIAAEYKSEQATGNHLLLAILRSKNQARKVLSSIAKNLGGNIEDIGSKVEALLVTNDDPQVEIADKTENPSILKRMLVRAKDGMTSVANGGPIKNYSGNFLLGTKGGAVTYQRIWELARRECAGGPVIATELHLLEALAEEPEDPSKPEDCNYLAGFLRNNGISLETLSEAIEKQRITSRHINAGSAELCIHLLSFTVGEEYAASTEETQRLASGLLLTLFDNLKEGSVSVEERKFLLAGVWTTLIRTDNPEFLRSTAKILPICCGSSEAAIRRLETATNEAGYRTPLEKRLVCVWQLLTGKKFQKKITVDLDYLNELVGESEPAK